MLALRYIIDRGHKDVVIGVFMLVYNLARCQHNYDFFFSKVGYQVIDSHVHA